MDSSTHDPIDALPAPCTAADAKAALARIDLDDQAELARAFDALNRKLPRELDPARLIDEARGLAPPRFAPAAAPPPEVDGSPRFTPDSSVDDVSAALEAAAIQVRRLPPPRRAIERERWIEALGPVKSVSAPARVVDSFFNPRPAAAARHSQLYAVPEPSPEPQPTAILLADLTAAFARYVYLPAPSAVALALFALHTWAFEAADHTPRLAITSPTKQCGKSTVLALLRDFCRRPLLVANVTAAVVFRIVERDQPTLLLDESDTFLWENLELRGVLNAGYERTGHVARCAGDDNEARTFACFSPVAIAAIGRLPETLADRSIPVRMERKPPELTMARRGRQARLELEAFGPRLARWAADTAVELGDARPALPAGLNDRQRDISEPLLAIADHAGGEWPARARDALVRLCRGADADAADAGERLLAAVWAIFEAKEAAFLTLKALRAALLDDETGGWGEANRGKEITTAWLSTRLRRFGLESRQIRKADDRIWGYVREDLVPIVARYLAVTPRDEGSPIQTV